MQIWVDLADGSADANGHLRLILGLLDLRREHSEDFSYFFCLSFLVSTGDDCKELVSNGF